jgi:hypothetical protein
MRKVTPRTASMLKIGKLTFHVDNGCLSINIPEARFPHALTACETLALLNLLSDYKLDTILVAREEQKERERRRKEWSGRKKPTYVEIDGRTVIGVEISDLEQEYNGGTEDEPHG